MNIIMYVFLAFLLPFAIEQRRRAGSWRAVIWRLEDRAIGVLEDRRTARRQREEIDRLYPNE